MESCHGRLLEAAKPLNISFDDNKTASQTREFSACEKEPRDCLFDIMRRAFDIDKRADVTLESPYSHSNSNQGNGRG
jgi:hypothetical protein